jgi:glycosyltransferase involved in cell wall biosynthesis
VEPAESIGANRGGVVVCVGAGDERERLDRCLQSVLLNTIEQVPILVYGGSDSEQVVRGLSLPDRPIAVGADVDVALAAAAPADVVLLSSDCVVAEGWLDGLRDAAYADSRVASATALTSGTGPASIALPADASLEHDAAAIRAASPRIRPRLRVAGGHCAYIRRSALELVECFGNLDQFSLRCVESGLCHALADDVLVLAAGAPVATGTPVATRRPGASGASVSSANGSSALEQLSTGPLRRSLGSARRALEGPSIAIDARVLSGPMNGTKLHVLELIAAVARPGGNRVRAIVTADLDSTTRGLLEAVPGVEPTTVSAELAPGFRADVVHRPFQIDSPADLAFLGQLGERLVITQQDLIAYHNPSYFRSDETWEGYRSLTSTALAAADRVLFFSAHARADALAEELVGPDRATVVQIGVDHHITRSSGPRPLPPQAVQRLPADADVMLCLGTSYRHKNRIFALRVLGELQRRHDWRGRLLFAGPSVPFGSSLPDEQRLMAEEPGLGEAVLQLGEVSEAEKAWLLQRASLVIYPTVSEGFGLVPFESAHHGVPCLWAKGTSLAELLPDAAAGIVPWDASASADSALALMRDEQARARNIRAVRDAAATLRWEDAGERLLEVYRETCDAPPGPTSLRERSEGLMHRSLSEDAVRLLGPDGALPRELERPLLALATHPRLRVPVFGAIKAGYSALRRLRGGRPGGAR